MKENMYSRRWNMYLIFSFFSENIHRSSYSWFSPKELHKYFLMGNAMLNFFIGYFFFKFNFNATPNRYVYHLLYESSPLWRIQLFKVTEINDIAYVKVDIIALKEIYTIFIEYGSELRSIISETEKLNTLFSHCVIHACLKNNYELIKNLQKSIFF